MIKKRVIIVSMAIAMVVSGLGFGRAHIAQAASKNTFVVMEGTTREITPNSYKVKYSVSDKKKIAIIKDKAQSYSKVSPKAGDGYNYGILVKGKKAGNTKLTLDNAGKKTEYNVKVLSKAGVNKKAKKALKKYVNKYSGKSGCAYMDFNGDGIKEVLHNGRFTYYNYAINKVVTKKAPVTDYEKLYISYKNKLMYATIKNEDNNSKEDAVDIGSFFIMNEAKVFDFLNNNVRIGKYTNPRNYLGDKCVEGTDYYLIRDAGYDQDDYWYEPYTKDAMDRWIDELMPDKVEVKLN